MRDVKPEVRTTRKAGEAGGVEAGKADLVTVRVTATMGVAFGGSEVTRAVRGKREAEALVEAAVSR